jgi:RNA polymerase sigma-70 factor (ECF subfamily)
MTELTDEHIARLVQQGDVNIFGELVNRYEQKMARYARKFLFAGDEIKDVVQEVFLKAYINIRSFDPARRFSPWLYRIAHNELINAVKKKSRLPTFSFDLDALFPHLAAKENVEGELERKEALAMLEHSLDKLSPKYKEALVLYYIEELEYKEIAEILQIPISTVGVRLQRGRSLLKKIVKQ